MATKQISILTIFPLIFLLFLLRLPGTNEAVYRILDLSLGNKQKDSKIMNFNQASMGHLLAKSFPLPPSAPSRRHDEHTNGDASSHGSVAWSKSLAPMTA